MTYFNSRTIKRSQVGQNSVATQTTKLKISYFELELTVSSWFAQSSSLHSDLSSSMHILISTLSAVYNNATVEQNVVSHVVFLAIY
jgi:hypothetical protein